MTVGEAIRDAAARLDVDWARDEAEMLMAHALGVSRSAMLLGHMRDPAPAAFDSLLGRRLANEPVAYILGHAEFYGRALEVTPDVLIPRGDSETVIEAAREAFAKRAAPRRILDLGTGSGALLLTALSLWPEAEGWGLDRSPEALAVAIRNAHRLASVPTGPARFIQGDWTRPDWRANLGQFDLVLCNPPYVEAGAELDASVREFEPHGALFAGGEGLDDYRVLVPQLPALLTPGGVAVFEIGYRQAEAVETIANEAGFAAALRHDLAGRPRALILETGDRG